MQCFVVFPEEHHDPPEECEQGEDGREVSENNDEKRRLFTCMLIDQCNVIGTITRGLAGLEHKGCLYDDKRYQNIEPSQGFMFGEPLSSSHNKIENDIHNGHDQHERVR